MNSATNKESILIIEDDSSLVSLLSGRLESAGYKTEIATDGEKALIEIEKKPDLILLDIMLPKLSGLDVMKIIREKDEWGKKVPIIITSNLNPDDDHIISSVAKYSPAFYLVKANYSLEEIVEKIKSVLLTK